MDSGQQQNGTKLAYLSNGVDKQQKLPKGVQKTLAWSLIKPISIKQLEILKKSDHTAFIFML